jgi:hypothetical protein
MVSDVPRSAKWRGRVLAVAGLTAGLTLVVVPVFNGWHNVVTLWLIGIPLTGLFGYMIGFGIVIRIRYRTPEARAAYRERMLDTGPAASPPARSFFAHKATKDKSDILRCGVDGTAVVTLVADGELAKGLAHLVYLELDVTVGAAPAYHARTGEYLTPASSGSVSPGRQLVVKVHPEDPQRVAVDWPRSLRRTTVVPDALR